MRRRCFEFLLGGVFDLAVSIHRNQRDTREFTLIFRCLPARNCLVSEQNKQSGRCMHQQHGLLRTSRRTLHSCTLHRNTSLSSGLMYNESAPQPSSAAKIKHECVRHGVTPQAVVAAIQRQRREIIAGTLTPVPGDLACELGSIPSEEPTDTSSKYAPLCLAASRTAGTQRLQSGHQVVGGDLSSFASAAGC